MDLWTWLVIGLAAGVAATYLVGGVGFGLVGDAVVGIAGALLGRWIVGALDVRVPGEGVPGNALVAFLGAVFLLLLVRVVRGPVVWRGGWRPPWRRP